MSSKALQRKRNKLADEAGEGTWFPRGKGIVKACPVDVTFYPRLQRWITEDGKRRKIGLDELERDYIRLAL